MQSRIADLLAAWCVCYLFFLRHVEISAELNELKHCVRPCGSPEVASNAIQALVEDVGRHVIQVLRNAGCGVCGLENPQASLGLSLNYLSPR